MVVRLERNYRSTQVILDAASAVIANNRNRKEKTLWTDRKGGAKIVYFRGADELEEADYITRVARQALAENVDHSVAVLYRTNAQSRSVEDGLRQANIAYVVLGGVGFYERKEIKDALSYLKLVLNPHDDVALRRVINVPARGIGKGVMDALEQVDTGRIPDDLPPLLAGLQPTVVSTSLWTKLVTAVDQRLLTPRQVASLAAFRDLIQGAGRRWRGRKACRSRSARCIDQSGYLRDLREEHSEEADARIENLMELVSAAREYETREPEPSLGGFVDRLSLLVGRGQGAGQPRRASAVDDAALGQGARVSGGRARRDGRRSLPALAGRRKTKPSSKRSGACATSGITRARTRLVLTSAARRRVFGDYQGTQPSRFLDEIPLGSGRAGVLDLQLAIRGRAGRLGVPREPLRPLEADGRRAAFQRSSQRLRLLARRPVGARRPGAQARRCGTGSSASER